MNILSQYGSGTGAGSGLFMQASYVSNVPATLNDASIHSVLQSCINAGALPEPPVNNTTQVVMIYLDESVAVNAPEVGAIMCEPSGDNAFGYHYNFATAKGNQCYYSVIPVLDDKCIKHTCPGGCSLKLSQTQEQRRTQVTSHEFSEMITDPIFRKGWYGPVSDENGDICNGQSGFLTVGSNTWNVQLMYSKADDIKNNGTNYCLASAPTPILKLAGGPATPVTVAEASPERMLGFRSLLPLPGISFDAKAKKVTWDEDRVQRYARTLFYPLGQADVISNFLSVIRQFADIIEHAKK